MERTCSWLPISSEKGHEQKSSTILRASNWTFITNNDAEAFLLYELSSERGPEIRVLEQQLVTLNGSHSPS
jgi:hypothetical protein